MTMPMPEPEMKAAEAAAPAVERFQPGGVAQALVGGLLELALAAILLAASLEAGRRSQSAAATSLAVAAALWAALSLFSLATSALRAKVLAAELDDEAVVLHGLGGARRYRYDELSAVEVSRARTRLVARDGRTRPVRGVRGASQGRRFRTRVLARATEAAGRHAASLSGGAEQAPEPEPEGPS
ncbi:MAG TPA: hypothetical protein VF995_04265 [Actinomycetota bacterium]